MSDPSPAGEFLRHLSAARYARISELLDESLELLPGERGTWLATLQHSDPGSAALLRDLFAAQRTWQSHGFLDSRPHIPGRSFAGILLLALANFL